MKGFLKVIKNYFIKRSYPMNFCIVVDNEDNTKEKFLFKMLTKEEFDLINKWEDFKFKVLKERRIESIDVIGTDWNRQVDKEIEEITKGKI